MAGLFRGDSLARQEAGKTCHGLGPGGLAPLPTGRSLTADLRCSRGRTWVWSLPGVQWGPRRKWQGDHSVNVVAGPCSDVQGGFLEEGDAENWGGGSPSRRRDRVLRSWPQQRRTGLPRETGRLSEGTVDPPRRLGHEQAQRDTITALSLPTWRGSSTGERSPGV